MYRESKEMCPHPSRYIHELAGNAAIPITVHPQNRREYGQTHLGTSKSELGFGHSHLGFENADRFWALLETGFSPIEKRHGTKHKELRMLSPFIIHPSISASSLAILSPLWIKPFQLRFRSCSLLLTPSKSVTLVFPRDGAFASSSLASRRSLS